MDSKYYTREIKAPANKKEGLMNFVQMIINNLESGEGRNGLLLAVDLLEDIRTGTYNDVETGNIVSALHAELEAKHAAEMIKTAEASFAAGQRQVRSEIAERLGLVAA